MIGLLQAVSRIKLTVFSIVEWLLLVILRSYLRMGRSGGDTKVEIIMLSGHLFVIKKTGGKTILFQVNRLERMVNSRERHAEKGNSSRLLAATLCTPQSIQETPANAFSILFNGNR